MSTLTERLLQQTIAKGTVLLVGEEQVLVNFPPLGKFQHCQQLAEITAENELKEVAADLKAKPIDEKKWQEALENYTGDGEPKKPKNMYEQQLEELRNSNFMFRIGPYMLFKLDGSPAAENVEDSRKLRTVIEKDPELIKAIADKMQEFGETFKKKAESESEKDKKK